jgi:chemotaxis protein CheZ
MNKQAAPVSLQDRVESLKENHGENIAIEEIGSVVGSMINGSNNEDIRELAGELNELVRFVGAAKRELSSINAKSISNRDIPDANEQLDAIVDATESAASTIMDAAEAISEVAENVDEASAKRLEEVSTELFEASSFQDLTGQRITKVNKVLAHLEERLDALADAIGDEYIEPVEELETDEEGVALEAEDLLNGPQLDGEGNSQDEIDAILASFDF